MHPPQVARYFGRISGPLLDRVDLHVEVPRILPAQLTSAPTGESSEVIRVRVLQSREKQQARFGGM